MESSRSLRRKERQKYVDLYFDSLCQRKHSTQFVRCCSTWYTCTSGSSSILFCSQKGPQGSSYTRITWGGSWRSLCSWYDNLLDFTTFINFNVFAGSGPVCSYTIVFRIISYYTCNRADNLSIKLKIMCNYITNQRDFVYLVKTRVLSRKIGNWLESGCLKRLVQCSFIDVSSKASWHVLQIQLDKLVNPGLSKEEMKAAKQRERERRRRKKAKKKNQGEQ